jgi:hypothetical protein
VENCDIYGQIGSMVCDEIWRRKRLGLPPLKRLILGDKKRRQLIESMPMSLWNNPYLVGSKKETFIGLEVLVDFGDPERIEME